MNLERELKRFVRQIRPGLIGATSNPNVNLKHLIDELKGSPKQVEEISKALRDFLATRDFTTALTESGLTLESGARRPTASACATSRAGVPTWVR